jgi:hypothetical protein
MTDLMIANGKSKKKARHSLTGAYPAVRKYSYLRRYPSLRRTLALPQAQSSPVENTDVSQSFK